MNSKGQIKYGITIGIVLFLPYLLLILVMFILDSLGITWNW